MVWQIGQKYKEETKKIVWEVAPYLRGRGIDVGAGTFKVLPQAIAVDDCSHSHMFGYPISPDVRAKADDLSLFATHSLDYVYSSHLLEHLNEPVKALKEWWRVIKPKGYLVLYLPHDKLYPKV